MTPAKAERLLAVQRKLSAIKVKLGKKTRREMASLPEKYGFSTMEGFVATIQQLGCGSGNALGESRCNQGNITEGAIKEELALAEVKKVAAVAAGVWHLAPTLQNI